MRHTFSLLNFFAVLQSQGCADSTLGWIAVALAGLPAGEDSTLETIVGPANVSAFGIKIFPTETRSPYEDGFFPE